MIGARDLDAWSCGPRCVPSGRRAGEAKGRNRGVVPHPLLRVLGSRVLRFHVLPDRVDLRPPSFFGQSQRLIDVAVEVVDLDHPSLRGESLDHLVGHVPRMSGKGATGRVGGEKRRARSGERSSKVLLPRARRKYHPGRSVRDHLAEAVRPCEPPGPGGTSRWCSGSGSG
jgi:hypothetical protein